MLPAPPIAVLVEVIAGAVCEAATADEPVELESAEDVVDEGVELGDWPVLAVVDDVDDSWEAADEVELRDDVVVVPGAVSDSRGTVRLVRVELDDEDVDVVMVVATTEELALLEVEVVELVLAVVKVAELLDSIDELVVELVNDDVVELEDDVLLMVVAVEVVAVEVVVVDAGVELGTLDDDKLVLVVGMTIVPEAVDDCCTVVWEAVVGDTSDAGAVPEVVVGVVAFPALHGSLNWANWLSRY